MVYQPEANRQQLVEHELTMGFVLKDLEKPPRDSVTIWVPFPFSGARLAKKRG